MIRHARFFVVIVLLGLAPACATSLRNARISDLQRSPGRYQDRSVNINGVVTSSWGIPLVPFRLYKVNDGTGEITVLSQASRTPTKGARVHVKGKVDEIAWLGGQSVGLHLREEKLDVKR